MNQNLRPRTLPFFHKLAFNMSSKGLSGSNFYWRVAYFLNDVPDNQIVSLPSGFLIEPNKEDWTGRTIYEGTYERPLLKFLNHLIFSGLSIDVGANLGITLFHALRGNLLASFVAFEPSLYCFHHLERLAQNLTQSGNIVCAAVAEESGLRSLFDSDNKKHSGSASLNNYKGQKPSQENVQVYSLDSYMDRNFGEHDVCISLLKIDTEGFEKEVIAGAKELIGKNTINVIILEVSPNFGDTEWIGELNGLLNDNYYWFEISEVGLFRKKPILRAITIEMVLQSKNQFNLTLINKLYPLNIKQIDTEIIYIK